jgi:hypothetical protein
VWSLEVVMPDSCPGIDSLLTNSRLNPGGLGPHDVDIGTELRGVRAVPDRHTGSRDGNTLMTG